VSSVSSSLIRSFKILADKRFYPGIAIPTVQLIGPGSSPTILSAIDAPGSMEAAASLEQEQQEPVTSRNARMHAPRVTGSFDHPVLPMPPVGNIRN
jgi:hypothetical protein